MTKDTTDAPAEEELHLDMKEIEADAAAAVRAYTKLLNHAADDWDSWSIVIQGLRGLRDLAFSRSGYRDIKSWHYRQALGDLLSLRKYGVLANINKQTRSYCYALMDNLEAINVWYVGLPAEDKLRWRHPESIAKNAPRHLLAKPGHNKPPKNTGRKKPLDSAEITRLKDLLIQVIKRLAKYEPDAVELLDQVARPEPNDQLDDLFTSKTSQQASDAHVNAKLADDSNPKAKPPGRGRAKK